MFLRFKLAILLVFGLAQTPAGQNPHWESASPLELKYQIEQNFFLNANLPARDLQATIRRGILMANPESDTQIGREIFAVSKCVGVDPLVFTALIWRESNFRSESQSETGAVGLTQMTSTGIQEVLERTQHRGARKLKYLRGIFARCAPDAYRHLPQQVDAESIAKIKSSIAAHPREGLMFGALLLKINLARIPHRLSPVDLYLRALERYNGDPRIKAIFAREVLTLTKRLTPLPEVAVNNSKFVRMIRGL